MKGLNLDDLLASLKQEKTAEEIFADNLVTEEIPKEAPEETPETPEETPETPEETSEETPEETPETPEETPEKTPEETPEKTPEETPADLSKVSSLLGSEWVPFEHQGKKFMLKNATDTMAIMSKSDLSLDQKFNTLLEKNLIKSAEVTEKVAGIEEQAKLFAATFYQELRKLAEAEEKETPQEQVKEAEVTILTNLYTKYFGEV